MLFQCYLPCRGCLTLAVGLWLCRQVHHTSTAEPCLDQSQISALTVVSSLRLYCAPHSQPQRCLRSPVELTCWLTPALQAAAVQQAPGSSASRPPSARVKRKFEDVEQGEVPAAGPTAVQQAPVVAQGPSRDAVAVPTAGGGAQAPASIQGLSLPPGDGPDASLFCTCCYHSGILGHLEAVLFACALQFEVLQEAVNLSMWSCSTPVE